MPKEQNISLKNKFNRLSVIIKFIIVDYQILNYIEFPLNLWNNSIALVSESLEICKQMAIMLSYKEAFANFTVSGSALIISLS